MRAKKIIIGNWKMFKNKTRANDDFSLLVETLSLKKLPVDVGIAAPSVFLSELAAKTRDVVTLFAQNVHWADEGPFTGEVSAPMLKSLDVAGSLVAHSERRQLFGESNKTAGMRLAALLHAGMQAVLCIGETLAEREQGKLKEVLETQIEEALNSGGLKTLPTSSALFAIAYEPVWAIGTGKSATAAEAEIAHNIIRAKLTRYFSSEAIAQQIPLLYGGSVNKNNITTFMTCSNIDGALVGGASLTPADFVTLCENL